MRHADKVYYGRRTPNGCRVTKRFTDDAGHARSIPLNPQLKLRNHSPDGFEWGYGGSGPAQLALALLVDAVGDTRAGKVHALAHYQTFKFEVVARLARDEWELSHEAIKEWLDKKLVEAPRVG